MSILQTDVEMSLFVTVLDVPHPLLSGGWAYMFWKT